jgi:IS5 family transposase|tara:strand:+ start:73 stop:1041 length:969 start_codon:yes stop_codon:yes gene_type:complete
MKQLSLASGFEVSSKRTRKRVFLEEMDRVVPWRELVALIEPHYWGKASTGRPPFPCELMLRIHFLQQWFGHSDPAMEESLHDVPLYPAFIGIDPGSERLPDESTILRFRHLLEQHRLAPAMLQLINELLSTRGLMLKAGTAIDATLIHAPSSTKNSSGERDPEMHQTKKGNQWFFGMKAHIGVDADSGLVHAVVVTAANVHDLTPVDELLHGDETQVHTDAGYQGVDKREELKHHSVQWQVAMRPGKRRALPDNPMGEIMRKLEETKARIRAKVEHPFRVIKRQFGYTKVRYRGLAKNTAQLQTLFALSNLWMVRRRLMVAG